MKHQSAEQIHSSVIGGNAMFTVDDALAESYPAIQSNPFLGATVPPILRKMMRESDFLSFGERYSHL
ncbi:MAG: hypothetical protein U9R57_15435, partial [Thermodesulfobacteriota bacterium]|nr:hypothetical protein [Thermodesulfobacteriota bacterium]